MTIEAFCRNIKEQIEAGIEKAQKEGVKCSFPLLATAEIYVGDIGQIVSKDSPHCYGKISVQIPIGF